LIAVTGKDWPRFRIDMRSPEPAYLQLAAQLRAAIGDREPGDRVPSTQQLVGETGLAIGTVQKAVKLIIGEELAYTVPGRGTFVR
jgi:DNA-binding transcriptional regulator YhcF (GntR family)